MHKNKGNKCCRCGCAITWRPRPPEAPIAICGCGKEPFMIGPFVKPLCNKCHNEHCSCKKEHHHHHHNNKKQKVALPRAIADALKVLIYQEGWPARELILVITDKSLNPTLSLSEEMKTVYTWANEKGKQDERLDLLLKAFDYGFYADSGPEQQIRELFKRYDQLEEPYRTNALNIAREILAVYHIDSPIF